MHQSVMEWGRAVVLRHGLTDKSVLEVGSLNVNGSLREMFDGPYIGVDKLPGKGVDQIADANRLEFDNRTFDVVVCTEMLAHDPHPWKTVNETYRLLKLDGYLLLTARGIGFGRNDSPCDYYRFTPEAIKVLMTDAGYVDVQIEADPQYSGVLALGRKA
jgi:SAM-dependent methyltransferase